MIMKKFLLMSTLCALALVGCKDDSEPEIPTDIDYSGLVLNEICGNDGNASEEEWIEIYNQILNLFLSLCKCPLVMI